MNALRDKLNELHKRRRIKVENRTDCLIAEETERQERERILDDLVADAQQGGGMGYPPKRDTEHCLRCGEHLTDESGHRTRNCIP
jgi:hypothetical protein